MTPQVIHRDIFKFISGDEIAVSIAIDRQALLELVCKIAKNKNGCGKRSAFVIETKRIPNGG